MKRKFRLIIAACVLSIVALTGTGCGEKTAPTFPHTTDGDPTDAKYFDFDLNAAETGYIISAKADADLPLYLILPATYEEKPVVAIKERGFAGGEFISVSIPAGVTETGIRAFADCKYLATVVYGKDVEKNSAGEYAATQIIRSYAFSGCTKLEYLTLTAVSKIDGGAFVYCNKLKSVTVEKTAEVAADAFPSTVKVERRV